MAPPVPMTLSTAMTVVFSSFATVSLASYPSSPLEGQPLVGTTGSVVSTTVGTMSYFVLHNDPPCSEQQQVLFPQLLELYHCSGKDKGGGGFNCCSLNQKPLNSDILWLQWNG